MGRERRQRQRQHWSPSSIVSSNTAVFFLVDLLLLLVTSLGGKGVVGVEGRFFVGHTYQLQQKQSDHDRQHVQHQQNEQQGGTKKAATTRIVGGNEVKSSDDFPFFVNLGGCAGTLIHGDIILTAAHCTNIRSGTLAQVQARVRKSLVVTPPSSVSSASTPSSPSSLLTLEDELTATSTGNDDDDDDDDDDDGSVLVEILDVVPHPLYNDQTKEYDFMVVKVGGWTRLGNVGVVGGVAETGTNNNGGQTTTTATPAISKQASTTSQSLSQQTNVVVLNSDPSIPTTEQSLTILGMGRTSEDGLVSQTLKETTVYMIGDDDGEETCQALYPQFMVNNDVVFCASDPEYETDSCDGDSAGPLLLPLPSSSSSSSSPVPTTRYLLVGIVSWGVGCSRKENPGVYARISVAYNWITTMVCLRSDRPPPECATGTTATTTTTTTTGRPPQSTTVPLRIDFLLTRNNNNNNDFLASRTSPSWVLVDAEGNIVLDGLSTVQRQQELGLDDILVSTYVDVAWGEYTLVIDNGDNEDDGADVGLFHVYGLLDDGTDRLVARSSNSAIFRISGQTLDPSIPIDVSDSTNIPSARPSASMLPSIAPTETESMLPSVTPSMIETTVSPSFQPSLRPSNGKTPEPSINNSTITPSPTLATLLSILPTVQPTSSPAGRPIPVPTASSTTTTPRPTLRPTQTSTPGPTVGETSLLDEPTGTSTTTVVDSNLGPSPNGDGRRPVAVGLYIATLGEENPRDIGWELIQEDGGDGGSVSNVLIRRQAFGSYREEGIFYENEIIESGYTYTFSLLTRSESGTGKARFELSVRDRETDWVYIGGDKDAPLEQIFDFPRTLRFST